jgi:putative transposase
VVVQFIDAYRSRFGVVPICRVLSEHGCSIAPSSYYAYKARPASPRALRDAQLAVEIRRVFVDPQLGRGLYGARKVWRQLGREGIRVARCTVERLMRREGLEGCVRGRAWPTTRADRAAPRPPDLVDRNFAAAAPNRLWVVDFTYVATWRGVAYTALVIDVFSRRIVGWRTAASMPTGLPLDALEMALFTRSRSGVDVRGLVHHSDAGSQYTAIRYTERLRDAGALPSIGSVGDSYDNALAESTIGLYKAECTRREGPWRGVDELELATLGWVHWYNSCRLHSSIGNVPPVEHEQAYYRQRAAAAAGDGAGPGTAPAVSAAARSVIEVLPPGLGNQRAGFPSAPRRDDETSLTTL